MDVFRTPDERFEGLPGYDFEPHYAEVDGLRLHYVDEGPRETGGSSASPAEPLASIAGVLVAVGSRFHFRRIRDPVNWLTDQSISGDPDSRPRAGTHDPRENQAWTSR